ncbi:MAG: hypothetical protein UR48_C0032G0012, partial [Microgenomates group bacterium GW2011_GWD1_33_9]
EWYTTVVQGDPNAAKKIHSAYMHQGPPYKQLVFVENDLDSETKTVGGIQPLICVDAEGKSFVAVQYKQRHNGVVAEAFRKAWSRPEEQTQILAEGGEVTNYKDIDLGRGLANDARLVGPDDKLAQIVYELTVVKGGTRLPEIDKGNWMPVEEFLMTTREHMGKGVVAIAGLRSLFPVSIENMNEQAVRLPALIKEWSE